MADLSFSAHQLILKEDRAAFDDLKDLFLSGDDTYKDAENFYQIQKQVLDGRYMWLHAAYGKAYPRTDVVIETTTFLSEDNPRKPTQVEPDKQFFSLYDATDKVLHVSTRQKIGFYQLYLKDRLQKDFFVKNFYINVDEFAQKIKTVSSVKLITSNNLFSAASKLFEEEKNVFGLGEPANFSLEAVFSNADISDNFVRKLKDILKWRNQGEVESLVCIGKDDKGVESVFNVDSFIEKVELDIKKNKQGLYDVEDVKKALLSKLQERTRV